MLLEWALWEPWSFVKPRKPNNVHHCFPPFNSTGDSLWVLLARTTKAIFEKLLSVYIVTGRDARSFVLALALLVDVNFGTGKLRSEKIIRIGIEVNIKV